MNKDANGFAFSRLNITYWAIESESKLWVWWHWHSQGSRSICVDGHGLYCLSAAGWLNSVNWITLINKESTKWASRDVFVQRGLSEAKRYDCVSWRSSIVVTEQKSLQQVKSTWTMKWKPIYQFSLIFAKPRPPQELLSCPCKVFTPTVHGRGLRALESQPLTALGFLRLKTVSGISQRLTGMSLSCSSFLSNSEKPSLDTRLVGYLLLAGRKSPLVLICCSS